MSYADVQPSRDEKIISGAFAFGMHLLFFALLMFGVNWQRTLQPQANSVDLYATLEPESKPVEPPPQPEVRPEPKPIEPPPVKVEVKPAPKPEIAKPDIALKKEKAEKDRRALEEKQKEAKKREEEKARLAAREAQRAKEAEAQRAVREQEVAMQRAAEQAAAARSKLVSDYTDRIKRRIRQFVVLPPNMQGNPEAEFDVVLLPGGEVLGVKLKRSSGVAAYDSAVERAILKAQPLPLPPDPTMFSSFRDLNLSFRPKE